jgi:CRISPR/Cas system endoribonuclease Cas6 (RAMP superfamily)
VNYLYNIQGLIYNLIKETQYAYVHDKKGFKFFCFSNIIPISSPIVKDDVRTLIISSPDNILVNPLDLNVTFYYSSLSSPPDPCSLRALEHVLNNI